MQLSEQMIRSVVEQVLSQMGTPGSPMGSMSNGNGTHASALAQTGLGEGIFSDVDSAVAATTQAFATFRNRSIAFRRQVTDCIRRVCIEGAEDLGRLELEETKIGRLDHKIEKLITAGHRTPGVEMLETQIAAGDHGLTLTNFVPFGVIAAITPVTHSLPTLASNAINMLAAGNTVVYNAHPSGASIAMEGVRRFNRLIRQETGLTDLLTIVHPPTLESAQRLFSHRDIALLVVTGGASVARAALGSNRRAIVAGPGNPPVVVDETADLDNAAKSIVLGAAYDNNLLCIGEKQVFAVASIFDALMNVMSRHQAYRLQPDQIDALTRAAFQLKDGGKLVVNKAMIGQDPVVLAQQIGLSVPPGTQLLYGETGRDHAFVDHEQMMPFVPFVRVANVDEAIAAAVESEHGYGHTAILHSNDAQVMERMGRAMNCTIFVVNGPCVAGLGSGGEGVGSYSIAGPTGEGVTTPLTFTRQHRTAIIDGLRFH